MSGRNVHIIIKYLPREIRENFATYAPVHIRLSPRVDTDTVVVRQPPAATTSSSSTSATILQVLICILAKALTPLIYRYAGTRVDTLCRIDRDTDVGYPVQVLNKIIFRNAQESSVWCSS
jgi:hypothetical protein